MLDEHGHKHGEPDDPSGMPDLTLDTRTTIFLTLRQQNLELLQVATKIAGYSGDHGPLKPGDVRNSLKTIWDIYSELYSWVDPEETDEDEDEEDLD